MDRGRAEGPPLVRAECRRYNKGAFAACSDVVAPEHPVLLNWPGREPVRLWAYPESLEHLALGHALLEFCEPGRIPVLESRRDSTFFLAPAADERRLAPASACRLDPETLLAAMDAFVAMKGRWEDTGCFHRMAALDPETGGFLHVVEDIGRHNCIDRMAGWALVEGRNPASLVLCVSARATASLVGKAVSAGFGCLVSKSAVTTAGIEIAYSGRMSLAGFARSGRFTVYAEAAGGIGIKEAGELAEAAAGGSRGGTA